MTDTLKPIRFMPEHRWFFVKTDIDDAYGRAMFALDIAIWTWQDYLHPRSAPTVESVGPDDDDDDTMDDYPRYGDTAYRLSPSGRIVRGQW